MVVNIEHVDNKDQAENGGVPSGSRNPSNRRRKMADLRAFVETRLLSRSDKMLEKMDEKHARSSSFLTTPRQVIIK